MARDKGRDRQSGESGAGEFDDQEAYDRALRRESEELPGDMEEDRNLSGGSTYETLSEEEDADEESDGGTLDDDRDQPRRP